MEISEKVAAYFEEEHPFKAGIQQLREVVLKTELSETYKWLYPTYTYNGKNVLSICRFKKHFCIWFFNGAFLSDKKQVLSNAQEGKTQAMRIWKFHEPNAIDTMAVLAYVMEAFENEKKGVKLIPNKKTAPKVVVPQELAAVFSKSADIKKAFDTLSPFQQRDYSEYIRSAKRETTKETRLKKILPLIKAGKALNTLYRKSNP